MVGKFTMKSTARSFPLKIQKLLIFVDRGTWAMIMFFSVAEFLYNKLSYPLCIFQRGKKLNYEIYIFNIVETITSIKKNLCAVVFLITVNMVKRLRL